MSNNIIPRFLNLGCGAHFSNSPEWLNIDIFPQPGTEKFVRQYQLGIGIPFADCRFEVVYQSHMLEHFPRSMVPPFLRECFRVLRPGGILRIAVSNLESIIRQYLATLEDARKGDAGAEDRHLWMQVELLDKLTRRKSGGNMDAAWANADGKLASFIRSRVGGELDNIPRSPQEAPLQLPEDPLSLPVVDTGFIGQGELHQWMYDEVSLSALLRDAGFVDIHVAGCDNSAIPDFKLDMTEDGKPRKPDSLYMEARKPAIAEINQIPVPIISASDKGGAGIAAMRIHSGLRKYGCPSIVYTQRKEGSGSQIYVLPPPPGDAVLPDGNGGAFLTSARADQMHHANALTAYPNRVQDWETFSPSEASIRLADVPLLNESKIIHFNWVANFMDIPKNAEFLKDKKIIWTLHDMNPFTGGCHYAQNCIKYRTKCENCPQLNSRVDKDLAYRSWKRKNFAFQKLDMNIVAPSKWLVNEAAKSSLFGRFPIHYIPNGVDTDIFKPYDRKEFRQLLDINTDARILLFSADGVLNKRKGLAYLLDALEKLKDDPVQSKLELVVMGRGSEILKSLPYKIKILGNITSPKVMALVYSAADVLVLPTLEDNLPNVLLESLACGTPAVAFNVGGVPDIIDHDQSGWLAVPKDVDSLALNIRKALTDTNKTRRVICRAKILENFSIELMATRFKKLYASLLDELEL